MVRTMTPHAPLRKEIRDIVSSTFSELPLAATNLFIIVNDKASPPPPSDPSHDYMLLFIICLLLH